MKRKVLQSITLFSIIIFLISIISVCINLEKNYVTDIELVDKDKSLVINEVLADNNGGLSDEDGEYTDWIEIYNYGEEEINLKGYGITTDLEEPFYWTFPDINISPKSFIIVRASGKDRKDNLKFLHTNFKINKKGENIYLTHISGEIIDSLEVPESDENISFGRKPDGTNNYAILSKTTPGSSNKVNIIKEVIAEQRLESPIFSHEGGYYSDTINLELYTEDDSLDIYYTLDGSEPTLKSNLYKGSIKIESREGEKNNLAQIKTSEIYSSLKWKTITTDEVFKGTVVRAKTYKDGVFSDETVTNTYFINPEYTLPIVSLVTDEDNLFGYENGIYVPGQIYDTWKRNNKEIFQDENGTIPSNYNQKGKEWEREAHIEVFETNGKRVVDQNVGIRISGEYSRNYTCKSLKIYAREEYDDKGQIEYNLFKNLQKNEDSNEYIDIFKRIKLRNSGSDFNYTLFKDALVHSILEDTSITTQAYRPSVLFINGEYWGIHNIRENLDEYYVESHYGVDKNNVIIIEPDDADSIYVNVGQENDIESYDNIIKFVQENDMSIQENYEYIKTKIDIDNFIQYIVAQTYINNIDWPQNNVKVWRSRNRVLDLNEGNYEDGKWRWMLFDTDRSFDNYESIRLEYILNPNISLEDMPESIIGEYDKDIEWSFILIQNLFKNEEFRTEFVDTFNYYLDTIFTSENVVEQINEMAQILEPEIEEHFNRWGMNPTKIYQLVSKLIGKENEEVTDWKAYWKNEVDKLIEFAENRPKYIRQYLEENF